MEKRHWLVGLCGVQNKIKGNVMGEREEGTKIRCRSEEWAVFGGAKRDKDSVQTFNGFEM